MSPTYQEILERMNTRFTQLSGLEPDTASDIGIRIKLLAGEIYSLTSEIEYLKRQMFPTTATGDKLDLHAMQRGLERIKGSRAEGTIVFTLEAPLEYNLIIPAGTICTTGDGSLNYITKQDAVIYRGSSYAWVRSTAEDSGERYNIGSGKVNTIVTYFSVGIRINNSTSFTGGTDDETDEQLRERLAKSYKDTPDGANEAYFERLALSVDGIQSAKAYYHPSEPGWGIIVLGGRGAVPDTTAFDEASELLNSQKPFGVNFLIQRCSTVVKDISVSIQVSEGYLYSSVKTVAEESIRNFFLDLSVGEDVLLAALGKALLETEGVENYSFAQGSQDSEIVNSCLAVLGTLSVSEMN